jgi:2'-5' RNA ligase
MTRQYSGRCDFVSIKEWAKEERPVKRDHYGCVMLEAQLDDWKDQHLDGIDENDVYDDGTGEYGYEETPHLTLIYGIHEDGVDPSVIKDVIKDDIMSFSVIVDSIGYFEGDEFDVVKYEIRESKELKKYRKLFMKSFENTQTYKEYHPHMTLAYVIKGEAAKYKKKLDEPFVVTFTRGVYSYHTESEGKIKNMRSVVRLRKKTDPKEPDLK